MKCVCFVMSSFTADVTDPSSLRGSKSTEPEVLPWLLGVCRVSPSKAFPFLLPPQPLGSSSTKGEQVWLEQRAPFRGWGHGPNGSEWFTPRSRLYCMSRFTALPNAEQLQSWTLPNFKQDSQLFTKQAGIFRSKSRFKSETGISDWHCNFFDEIPFVNRVLQKW